MQLLCLANSFKAGGRCLAGLKWPEMTEWIRPVASTRGAQLSVRQASVYGTFGNFREIQLLELIEVPLLQAVPLSYQPENWLIDELSRISLIRKVSLSEVRDALMNRARSRGNFFERIPSSNISVSDTQSGLGSSLELVNATGVRFWKNDGGKLRVNFNQLGDSRTFRDFPVTDPVRIQNHVSAAETHGDFLLTFSLGEEFNGRHYVLNCGVIPLDSDNF